MTAASLETHLSNTWLELTGEAIQFTPTVVSEDDLKEKRYFIVAMKPCAEMTRSALVVALAPEDELKLASSMFFQDELTLTEEEVQDACGELCNIFAGGAGIWLLNGKIVDLDSPSCLQLDQLLKVFGASAIRRAFKSLDSGRHILVIYFEPMIVPSGTGWAPRK